MTTLHGLSPIEDWIERVHQLEKKVEIATEALQYYAHPSSHECMDIHGNAVTNESNVTKARKALLAMLEVNK